MSLQGYITVSTPYSGFALLSRAVISRVRIRVFSCHYAVPRGGIENNILIVSHPPPPPPPTHSSPNLPRFIPPTPPGSPNNLNSTKIIKLLRRARAVVILNRIYTYVRTYPPIYIHNVLTIILCMSSYGNTI